MTMSETAAGAADPGVPTATSHPTASPRRAVDAGRRVTRRVGRWWANLPTSREEPMGPLLPWAPVLLACLALGGAAGLLQLADAPRAAVLIPAGLAGALLLLNLPQLGFLGFMIAVGLNWTVPDWPFSPTKAGAAVCVAGTALGLLIRGLRPRLHWMHLWLMAFACWSLVTAQAQGNGGLSLPFSFTMIGWVLVAVSAHQLFPGRRGLLQICGCYVLGVTLGCVLTITAFGTTGKATLVPLNGDANDFGMLASSAAALGLGLARERGRLPVRLAWLACALTCLTVAVGSYSRGAILGLAVAVVGQFLLRPRERRAILLGLAVLALAALCAYPFVAEQVQVAVQQKGFVAEGNVSSRFDAWTIALNQFAQHPITGIGIGALQPSYFAALTLPPGALVLAFAHNTYIEVLYGTGLVGAALIGTALVWSLRSAWRIPGMGRTTPPDPAPRGGPVIPSSGTEGSAASGSVAAGLATREVGGVRLLLLPALLCIFVACLTVTEIMYPPFWMAFLLAIAGADADQRVREVSAVSSAYSRQ